MPIHFWIVLAGLTAIVVLLAHRNSKREVVDYDALVNELKQSVVDQMPKPHTIRFYGGPLDGKEDKVLHDSPFGFIEYIPEDEESRQQIGEVMGQPIFAPKIAYYRMVTEGDYFYVRDVTADEARKAAGGIMPEAVDKSDS
jgi:hypothetical protein